MSLEKKKKFNNKIRFYRELLGLTQSELGEYLGIGFTAVIYDEKENKTNIGINKLYKYIDAFKKISREKSNGKLVLRLKLDDLVYETS